MKKKKKVLNLLRLSQNIKKKNNKNYKKCKINTFKEENKWKEKNNYKK